MTVYYYVYCCYWLSLKQIQLNRSTPTADADDATAAAVSVLATEMETVRTEMQHERRRAQSLETRLTAARAWIFL